MYLRKFQYCCCCVSYFEDYTSGIPPPHWGKHGGPNTKKEQNSTNKIPTNEINNSSLGFWWQGCLKAFWSVLGLLGASWGVLECLGASWGILYRLWVRLGCVLDSVFGASWVPSPPRGHLDHTANF